MRWSFWRQAVSLKIINRELSNSGTVCSTVLWELILWHMRQLPEETASKNLLLRQRYKEIASDESITVNFCGRVHYDSKGGLNWNIYCMSLSGRQHEEIWQVFMKCKWNWYVLGLARKAVWSVEGRCLVWMFLRLKLRKGNWIFGYHDEYPDAVLYEGSKSYHFVQKNWLYLGMSGWWLVWANLPDAMSRIIQQSQLQYCRGLDQKLSPGIREDDQLEKWNVCHLPASLFFPLFFLFLKVEGVSEKEWEKQNYKRIISLAKWCYC